MQFIEHFFEKMGDPYEIESLNEYINFLKNYKLDETKYFEKHHILPRSVFPEYIEVEENIISLNYEDHVKAHILLYKAYPIKQTEFPLRFMKENWDSDEYALYRSESAKNGWEKLKLDKKRYNEWRRKRSEWMKQNNPMHIQEIRDNWSDIVRSEKYRTSQKNNMDEYWSDSRSEDHRRKMKELWKRYTHEERSKRSSDNWKNKTEEQKIAEIERLRISAEVGSKIGAERSRQLWATEEYKSMMKEKRSGFLWWNNGEISIKSRECPGEGWVRGRAKLKHRRNSI